MALSFPTRSRPRVSPLGTVLYFNAKNEGADVVCELEIIILQDRFFARSSDPVDLIEAFQTNRYRIEEAAAAKLPQRLAQGLAPRLRLTDF